ncbi:MAG: hypothetical protein WA851_09000 [Xanthobacteraceae bacterium]
MNLIDQLVDLTQVKTFPDYADLPSVITYSLGEPNAVSPQVDHAASRNTGYRTVPRQTESGVNHPVPGPILISNFDKPCGDIVALLI